MRTCKKCTEEKPLEAFHRARGDRREWTCAECRLRVKAETRRARRAGLVPTSPPPNKKVCTKCKVEQPWTEFQRNDAVSTGLSASCRNCIRAYLQKKHYQLSPGEYEEMVLAQGGCCLICGTPSKLAVDHCHDSGKVRGLLCRKCNVGLGHFDDDPDRLMAAASYLMTQVNLLTT